METSHTPSDLVKVTKYVSRACIRQQLEASHIEWWDTEVIVSSPGLIPALQFLCTEIGIEEMLHPLRADISKLAAELATALDDASRDAPEYAPEYAKARQNAFRALDATLAEGPGNLIVAVEEYTNALRMTFTAAYDNEMGENYAHNFEGTVAIQLWLILHSNGLI